MATIVGGFGRPAVRLGPPPPFLLAGPPRASGNGAAKREFDKPASRPPRRTRQVFVAYPYGLFDRADYRGVFATLGRVHGVKFVFADERITNLQVVEKIRNQMQVSDFCLFDVSGWNANVAFELGMAYEMPNVDWYICFNPDKNGRGEVPSNIRGLDRLEYRGFSELQEKLNLLLERWYPPDDRETLDDFAEKLKSRALDAVRLRGDSGMDIGEIADALKIKKDTAQFAVRQLASDGKLSSRGKSRATRYFLKK